MGDIKKVVLAYSAGLDTTINAGVWSPYSLYSEEIATFDAGGDYRQADATGFIRLYGLPTRVQAAVEQKVR